MDPVTALGVAATVVQFVGVAITVGKRLAEFINASPGDVPRSLQSISIRLPLLVSALSRIKSESQIAKYDVETRYVLQGVVIGCLRLVREINDITLKLQPKQGENVTSKLLKVVKSLKSDDRIVEIDRGLQAHIQLLILHQVVDGGDLSLPAAEETDYFGVYEKRVEPFLERDALLAKIDQCFFKAARGQEQRPVYAVLSGRAGVGKSQLALEYCHSAYHLGQFRTVFWLDATFHDEPVASILPDSGAGAVLITTQDDSVSGIETIVKVHKWMTPKEQEDQRQRVTTAIRNNDTADVQAALDNGFDANSYSRNIFGNSGAPVATVAAMAGSQSALALLLDHGASLSNEDHMTSVLDGAVHGGSLPTVMLCLDHEERTGVYAKQEDYNYAFRSPMEKGHTEILTTLLRRRPDRFDVDHEKVSEGLALAASKGYLEILKLLLSSGRLPQSERARANILTSAVKDTHLEVTRYLLNEVRLDPNGLDEYGETALIHAVLIGKHVEKESMRDEFVNLLLAAGASINIARRHDKRTALHQAASYGLSDTVALLLEHGADATLEDSEGQTALLRANRASVATLSLLASIDIPDPDIQQRYFSRPLLLAAASGDRELALLALKQIGPDVLEEPFGETPLLIALRNEQMTMARMLIRNGARQDIRDRTGQVALLIAAAKGFHLVVRDLAKARDSLGVDVQDEKGETPLIVAVRARHGNCVKTLLDLGADRDAVNMFGETALDIAEELGFEDVIRMLED